MIDDTMGRIWLQFFCFSVLHFTIRDIFLILIQFYIHMILQVSDKRCLLLLPHILHELVSN